MADVAEADISTLLDEGMRHYEAGSPAKALELWYRVLDLEPRHPKALEYVQYLRDNLHVDVREPGFGAAATTTAPNGDATPDWSAEIPPAALVEPAPAAAAAVPAELDALAPVLDAVGPELDAVRPELDAVGPELDAVRPDASAKELELAAPAPEPVAPPLEAAATVPDGVAAPIASAAAPAPAPALAGGWGDLAFGDLDLDPNTGKAVERAPDSDDVRQRRQLAVPPSPAAPVPVTVELAPVVVVPAEAPAIEMTPLPILAPAAERLADVSAHEADVGEEGGAPLDVTLKEETRPLTDVEEDAVSPWDGPSGLTEPVDLDVSPMGPSAMDLVLAGTARRPHADGGLRVQRANGEEQPALGSDDKAEPQSEVAALMEGARDLFQLGDFSGSLELVEKVLRQEPDNDEARAYLTKNEATLLQMYESKLGDLKKSPRVLTSPDEVIWMNLHHRAGFVLSQVDGELSYEDIAAISGMSRFETFRILAELIQNGVIG